MTSGVTEPQAKINARKRLERDERLVEKIRQGRPLYAIAFDEGMDYNVCRRQCVALAKKHNLEWKPDSSEEEFAPTTKATQALRHRLGNVLHDLIEIDKVHPIDVARNTGLPERAQRRARERPYKHDWTLSQIERLAHAKQIPVLDLLLQCMLSPTEYQKVKICINSLNS